MDYAVHLTPEATESLKRAAAAGKKQIRITIPAGKIYQSGSPYVIKLTSKIISELRKSDEANQSHSLLIAGDNFKQLTQAGGWLSAVLPIAQQVVASLASPPEENLAYKRLAELRGEGANDTAPSGLIDGLETALEYKDDPEIKALVSSGKMPTKDEFEEIVGSGMIGGSWKAFWDGFTTMILDPVAGFELLGRQLKKVFTGKGLSDLIEGNGVATHFKKKD